MGLQFRGSWEEPTSQGQATSHQDVDLGQLRGAPASPLKGPFPVGTLAPGRVRERHSTDVRHQLSRDPKQGPHL